MSLNIYQRINEVRKEITYVQKDKDVSTGKGSYKAVTHDAVTALVRPLMVKHGIVMIPSLVKSELMEADNLEAKQRRYVATYQLEFVNIDDGKDRAVVVIESHAMDSADKAPGKAISYAAKYALLKLFNIETGEDEESRYESHATITKEQVDHLLKLGAEVKADMSAFRKRIKVDHLEDLAAGMYDAAVALLEKKRPVNLPVCTDEDFKKKEAQWKQAIEAGDVTADDLIKTVGSKKALSEAQQETIKSWGAK